MNQTAYRVEHENSASADIGVLLVNLGTPMQPTFKSVWRYLAEFLSDPRVVELPRPFWLPILYGFVLPLRSGASAKAYRKIWQPEGSPLLVYSQKIADGLNTILQQQTGLSIIVTLGMRYGAPSIANALEILRKARIRKLVILPLYPQYSAATTASTFDAVSATLKTWRVIPELISIADYATEPAYITVIANSIKHYWQKNGSARKLLFSFHGLPKRSIAQGDPYYFACHQTAQLVAKELQLAKDVWQVVFQSRFGREEWLQPYCDRTLINLAKEDCKNVDIICPGFAADCLETLEEIRIRNQEVFKEAGGMELNYIPALNDTPEHLYALANIILARLCLEDETP